MSEQKTPEITDKMIQAALFDEEGNRHSDEEVAQMLYNAFHNATTIAGYATLLVELTIDAEEEEKLARPSQIGFVAYSSPDATEPNESGTMLGLALALKKYMTELGISPEITCSEVVRNGEDTDASRVRH